MNDWVPIATAIVGAAVGGAGSYFSMRRDRRETRSQVIQEAKETIDLLKEQNDLLRGQLSASEERERASMQREAALEARIVELEREYRTLVKTISNMGLCSDPQNCPAIKTVKRS